MFIILCMFILSQSDDCSNIQIHEEVYLIQKNFLHNKEMSHDSHLFVIDELKNGEG